MRAFTNASFTEPEQVLAKAYSTAFRAFIRGERRMPWLRFSTEQDKSTAWRDGPVPDVAQGYHKDHCDMFARVGYYQIWTSVAPTSMGLDTERAAAPLAAAAADA